MGPMGPIVIKLVYVQTLFYISDIFYSLIDDKL